MLCAVPALRALRAAAPHAHVTLLGLAQTRPLAARFTDYIDEFLAFPGYPGLTDDVPDNQELAAFLSDVDGRFDIALQMHGSGVISNPVAMLLGAAQTAGFYLPGHYCPDDARFLPWIDEESEVCRLLRLLAFLGIAARGNALEFPVQEADRAAFAPIATRWQLRPHEYVCVHPGARDAARRWSPERFAAVADTLAGWGLRVVLTGTAAEQPVTQAVAQAMRAPAVDLAGQTGLGALALLLRGARLLVSNDTGVSHLAAALGLPSVIIFLHTDPRRWAPLDRQRHRVVGRRHLEDAATRNCGAAAVAPEAVSVGQVLAQAEHLLFEEPSYAA